VHDGLQKRTRRENHGASEEACVAADTHTDSALLAIDGLGENLFDQFLAQIDVWVFFDLAFDIELIRFLIGLSPGGVHRRPLAAIEQPELDPRAISPINPPSASISRTIWPLATPPIAGLQLICPTVSRFPVRSATRAPTRAAAAAASVPACPAPTTTMSYSYLLIIPEALAFLRHFIRPSLFYKS
jgi:hypothetical protein